MSREKEIRERLAKARPGPWITQKTASIWADGKRHETGTVDILMAAGPDLDAAYETLGYTHENIALLALPADAEFIAHAPEDLAWCLAEIERLKGGAAEQRREFKAYRDMAVANENLLKAIVEEQQAEIERLKDPSTILREAARIQAMAPRGRGLP